MMESGPPTLAALAAAALRAWDAEMKREHTRLQEGVRVFEDGKSQFEQERCV